MSEGRGRHALRVSRRAWIGACLGAASVSPFSARTASAAPAVTDFSRGMHVVITGCGAALPVPERGNAGAAVVVDGTVIQFDCGRRTMDNLLLAGINPLKVDHLGFTHLHFDHIGEYGYFAVCAWIGGRQKPIDVFGPVGTVAMSDGAIKGAHHTDVTFVTLRAKGVGGPPMKSTAEPPVRARDVVPGVVVDAAHFKISAVETPHIAFVGPLRSLAYRVDSRYGAVVVSGDTAPSDAVRELAKDADLLVHECTLPPPGVISAGSFSKPWDRSSPTARTGHTSPAELGALAQKARVKKVVATHFGPYTRFPAAIEMTANFFGPLGAGPEVWTAIAAEIKRTYQGPVILAEDALVLHIGQDSA